MEHYLVFSEVSVDVFGYGFVHRVAAIAEVPPHVCYRHSAWLDCGCKDHSERRMADFRGGGCLDNGRTCFDVDDEVDIEEWILRIVGSYLEILSYLITGLTDILCVDRDLKLRGFAWCDCAACRVYCYSSRQRHFGVDQVHVAVVLRCCPQVSVAVKCEPGPAVVSAVRMWELVHDCERLEVKPVDHVRSTVVRYPQDAAWVPCKSCYTYREIVGSNDCARRAPARPHDVVDDILVPSADVEGVGVSVVSKAAL